MDFYFLLADEVFKTKTLITNFILFHFEIVLACSCDSLGTIYSTNIFGIVSGDITKVYIPWDIIIHLILRGEQNHKIFQTMFSPSSGSQWLLEILEQEENLLHLDIRVSHTKRIF